MPYGIIATKADLIVHGNISNFNENDKSYQFKIIDAIKGESVNSINVKIWETWTCDKRIKSHAINQELVLFLKVNNDGEYEIIHGSSGELFVSEKDLVSTFLNKNFPKIYELKKGIRLFNRAFKYYGELYDNKKPAYFVKTASGSIITKLFKENKFFNMAYSSIRDYKIK